MSATSPGPADAFGRRTEPPLPSEWGPPPTGVSSPAPGHGFAPPAADAPGERPRPLRALARVLLVVLVLGTLADAAAAITDIEQLSVLDRLTGGEDVPVGELDAADGRYALAGLLQSVAFFGTVVVWLIWFRRAYINVERLVPGGTRFGRGWAIGAWFVPFLNLWRPKQIANDIYRSGATDVPAGVPFQDRDVSRWLHVWWGLWTLANVLSRLGFPNIFGAQTLEDQSSSASATLAADLTSVPAGMAAFYVVLTLTRRQDRAADFDG